MAFIAQYVLSLVNYVIHGSTFRRAAAVASPHLAPSMMHVNVTNWPKTYATYFFKCRSNRYFLLTNNGGNGRLVGTFPCPILSLTDGLLTLYLCPSLHSYPSDCSSNLRPVWEAASCYVGEAPNVIRRIVEYIYREGIEQRDPTRHQHTESRRPGAGEPESALVCSPKTHSRRWPVGTRYALNSCRE